MASRVELPRPPLARPPRQSGRRRPASVPAPTPPARTDAPPKPPSVPTGESPPLRDRGLELMAAFTAAMLVMIVMAVVVGMVDAWWVLIPVMATDFAVTAAVLVVVVSLLNDGDGDGR